MANPASIVSNTRNRVTRILQLYEEMQAIGRDVSQEFTALGGVALAVGDYDWTGVDITELEFTNAVVSAAEVVPVALASGHLTNLYKAKV